MRQWFSLTPNSTQFNIASLNRVDTLNTMDMERPEEQAIDNLTKTQELDREKLLDLAETKEDVSQGIERAESQSPKRPMEKDALRREMSARLHGKVLYNKPADKEFRFLEVEMTEPEHIGHLKVQDVDDPSVFTYLTEDDISWQEVKDVNGKVMREALVSKDWELHEKRMERTG